MSLSSSLQDLRFALRQLGRAPIFALTAVLSLGLVSGDYFNVLGVDPAPGRLFGAGDDTSPNVNPIVVLSSDFWRGHLGADPSVIGSSVSINGHPLQVRQPHVLPSPGQSSPGWSCLYPGRQCDQSERIHREPGLRQALLQWQPLLLSRTVVVDVLRIAGVSLAVALPFSRTLTPLLQSQLFGVPPADVMTRISVVLLITFVALAATLIPARQAASVELTEALRTE